MTCSEHGPPPTKPPSDVLSARTRCPLLPDTQRISGNTPFLDHHEQRRPCSATEPLHVGLLPANLPAALPPHPSLDRQGRGDASLDKRQPGHPCASYPGSCNPSRGRSPAGRIREGRGARRRQGRPPVREDSGDGHHGRDNDWLRSLPRRKHRRGVHRPHGLQPWSPEDGLRRLRPSFWPPDGEAPFSVLCIRPAYVSMASVLLSRDDKANWD